jgi:DNA-binding NarL/FixJ family response regulator
MIHPIGAWWSTEGDAGMELTRVLIADDHPVFRDGLRLLLADETEIEVVGVAASGAEVAEAARELQPDVVVMDLHMPDVNGVEATRRIVRDSPHIAVLVLTMFDDNESVFAAMRAGARGYLLKGSGQAEIVRAIGAVGVGTAVFGPSIAQRVIDYFAGDRAGSAAAVFPELTDREREVLDFIAQGVNNTTIARKLHLSPKTIRNHVSNIFSKLQVADRAEAIVRARRAGLGED